MNTPETPTRHPQPQNDAPKPNLATLVDNLKAIENRDEDTLQVLMANWQQIVGTVVVALAFIWIYQRYQASQTVKLGEASARFADAQTSFGAIVNPAVAINPAIIQATPPAVDSAKPQELAAPNLEVDKARASFEENLKSLQAAHGSTTYARLSELYQAKSALAQGDLELARKILTPIAGGAFEKFETRKKLLANDPDLVARS